MAGDAPVGRRSDPRARDVLGMPVPPPRMARAATHARNGVERLHRKMAPPFQLVVERVFGLVDTAALYTAVELELPDLLNHGPRTASELAAVAHADADAVHRVLRYLVSRGIFGAAGEDRFRNNAASDVLRRDHPYSWRAWVEFFGSDWNRAIWQQMSQRVRTGTPAAQLAFGMPFFDYVNTENPEAGKAFNGAMASGSRLQGLLFAESIDFSTIKRVCDVGGGTGSTMAHLLRANPGLEGVVFDLPALAGEAEGVLAAGGVADRAVFVGGDFFASVPPDCDRYLLFAIVHDWDDRSCVRILATIASCMPPHAKIMVIERPVPRGDGPDFSKSADMLMLLFGEGGRERSQAEYEALFTSAGLDVVGQTTLPSLFEVYELAPRSKG